MTNDWMDMVKKIENAYITVMGQEKWDSLTEQQRHDVVMLITKDMLKALNSLE